MAKAKAARDKDQVSDAPIENVDARRKRIVEEALAFLAQDQRWAQLNAEWIGLGETLPLVQAVTAEETAKLLREKLFAGEKEITADGDLERNFEWAWSSLNEVHTEITDLFSEKVSLNDRTENPRAFRDQMVNLLDSTIKGAVKRLYDSKKTSKWPVELVYHAHQFYLDHRPELWDAREDLNHFLDKARSEEQKTDAWKRIAREYPNIPEEFLNEVLSTEPGILAREWTIKEFDLRRDDGDLISADRLKGIFAEMKADIDAHDQE